MKEVSGPVIGLALVLTALVLEGVKLGAWRAHSCLCSTSYSSSMSSSSSSIVPSPPLSTPTFMLLPLPCQSA